VLLESLAVLVGVAIGVSYGRRQEIAVARMIAAGGVLAAGALFGARVQEVVTVGGNLGSVLGGSQVGFRQVGVFLGVAIAIVPAKRLLGEVGIGDLADTVVISVLSALVVWRIGCLIEGCCFGIPTSLPWGIRYPQDSAAWNFQVRENLLGGNRPYSLWIHPLQAYFAVWAAAVASLLVWLRSLRVYEGQVALVGITLHEAGKAALEVFRADTSGGAAHVQTAAVAMAFLSLCGLAICEAAAARRRACAKPLIDTSR
jgi:phosphatidylglycerol:prolipoprotein diacylglycerol transferase